MTRRLNVAIVAPTLSILGGQSVQAGQLLASWQADPDVHAWLVPINPAPPGALRALARVKYARTLVTQAAYWPLLWRELRRADVVHVFSASYSSFLLSPLPAMLVAGWLGKPVLLNYHSGEAPDHLRRSRVARAGAGQGVAPRGAVALPGRRLRWVRPAGGCHPQRDRPRAVLRFACASGRGRASCRPAISSRSTTSPARCGRSGTSRPRIPTRR